MPEWVIGLLVFALTITLIVSRVLEESIAGLLGVVLMILLTSYTPMEAVKSIDWDVVCILLGMWIIAAYLIEAGLPRAIVVGISRRVKSYQWLVFWLCIAAGLVSMFLDNVLVILLFTPLVLEAAERSGADPVPAVLAVGFSANFMGTALLMGDLPPQLLHSVAGAEFLDFIWQQGRPSSFPLLLATFILVTLAYTKLAIDKPRGSLEQAHTATILVEEGEKQPLPTLLVPLAFFTATVAAMALRPVIGLPLGFITLAGAAALAATSEILNRLGYRLPEARKTLEHVEWSALLFYATLFSLVGGLEHTGVIDLIAKTISPLVARGGLVGYTAAYWTTALPCMFIEHDALLLTLLEAVKNLKLANPWPAYWAMAWAATLASNTTTAAAPALYVAITILERRGYRITAKKFLKHSIPYTTLSLATQYLITLPFWSH